MIDFWTITQDALSKMKEENNARLRKEKGTLTWKESYHRLDASFEKLYDGHVETKKHLEGVIGGERKTSLMHALVKFKERTAKVENKAVLMYVLSNKSARPVTDKPYSMALLKKVEEAVHKAIYKGKNKLTSADIGKPFNARDEEVIIDGRSFTGRDEDIFFNLTNDDYYTIDDYKVMLQRANKVVDKFEAEGRERGLICD
ncbi:MAG: hypothetical protein GXO35_08210 [Gammaproteobacteria bacterium]|nr:hypothetical protein [Gammaproteobacteria bacterium]